MALHWPTFFTRLGSAIVFCAIMMTGLLWNEWAFVALFTLIQALCLRDYFRLIAKIFPEEMPSVLLRVFIQIFSLLLVLFFHFQNELNSVKSVWHVLLFIPTVILLLNILNKKTSLQSISFAFLGIFYITMPVLMLLFLRNVNMIIPLALILMLWINDTMAYLVGSFIGKTPFSKISPKKTWEGAAGGALLTITGAAIWGYYAPYYQMTDWIIIAFLAVITGTAGDLFESKLKRLAEVKDSGAMMPGHGGALDRFDSLLVATPFVFSYVYIFM